MIHTGQKQCHCRRHNPHHHYKYITQYRLNGFDVVVVVVVASASVVLSIQQNDEESTIAITCASTSINSACCAPSTFRCVLRAFVCVCLPCSALIKPELALKKPALLLIKPELALIKPARLLIKPELLLIKPVYFSHSRLRSVRNEYAIGIKGDEAVSLRDRKAPLSTSIVDLLLHVRVPCCFGLWLHRGDANFRTVFVKLLYCKIPRSWPSPG